MRPVHIRTPSEQAHDDLRRIKAIADQLLIAELQAIRDRLDQIETRLSALEARANQQERQLRGQIMPGHGALG